MVVRETKTAFHAYAVAQCLPSFRASAGINLADYVLHVHARNRHFAFQPQFVIFDHGEWRYCPHNHPEITGFIGWRPYFNKRWPAGSGKLAFKEFCRERGLRTPLYQRSPEGMPAYLLKLNVSSFGRGMRGPFKAGTPPPAAAESAYYEAFISGRILKASYWDDRLLCLEVQDRPTVTGDGRRTVRQLIQANLLPFEVKGQWQYFEDMVAFQDAKLDDVPEQGRSLLVEYRYNANLTCNYDRNANVMMKEEHGFIVQQLREWGPTFLESIPAELRGVGTVYTVDAVADADSRVWLLEMNCNPAIHPGVYFGMFEGLFGPAEEPAETAAQSEAMAMAMSTLPLPTVASQASAMPIPRPTVGPARELREQLSRQEMLAVARFQIEHERLEEALRNLKPLITGPEVLMEALPLAARVYAQLRLTELAQDCYRRYLSVHQGAVQESFELGITYFERGENQRAEELWQQILEREPAHPPTLFYSGLLAAGAGRTGAARDHLQALVRSCPPDNLYVDRGRELLKEIESGAVASPH
jgi:hypothetical protein